MSAADDALVIGDDDRGEEPWNGVTAPRSRNAGPRFLTDVIIELGHVSRERVEEAIEAARAAGTTPEDLLLQSGALSADALARSIAERNGLDHLDLAVFKVDMAAANLISGSAAKRYDAVPVQFVGDRGLLIAMADPANVLAVDDIALMTGYEVRRAVASHDDIAALIGKLTRLDDVVQAATSADVEELPEQAEVVDLVDSAEDAPIIKLVNGIIAQAVEQGASDVHLAPDGQELRVRFRVDGVLQDSATVPRRMVSGVISRV
jgi:type IV pilus assembly protein PilB